jgi:formylglycine-generating enzyme required for sulfatase activity
MIATVGCDKKDTTQTPPPNSAGKEITLDLGGTIKLTAIRIPAGTFLMGSPSTEQGHQGSGSLDEDETQHDVTLTNAFYMGTTDVTVDQFAAFVADFDYTVGSRSDYVDRLRIEITDGDLQRKKMEQGSWRDPGFLQKADHPVVGVTWDDAKAFCEWMSRKSGHKVDLPSEAQWEYACRAGTKTAYPWGDDAAGGHGCANFADQSLQKIWSKAPTWMFVGWDDGFAFTSPVSSYKANAFGLYDMVGNVGQWCIDPSGHYETGPATNPVGKDFGYGGRVVRGGSWYQPATRCRAASRTGLETEAAYPDIGFRVVVLPDQGK